jgi:hypothetical protein
MISFGFILPYRTEAGLIERVRYGVKRNDFVLRIKSIRRNDFAGEVLRITNKQTGKRLTGIVDLVKKGNSPANARQNPS